MKCTMFLSANRILCLLYCTTDTLAHHQDDFDAFMASEKSFRRDMYVYEFCMFMNGIA